MSDQVSRRSILHTIKLLEERQDRLSRALNITAVFLQAVKIQREIDRVTTAMEALHELMDVLGLDDDNDWTNPALALKVLETGLEKLRQSPTVSMSVVVRAASRASGILAGYDLPGEVLAKYNCHRCGVRDVKLWRVAHSSHIQGWCSRCGTEQAGLPDNIDDAGCSPDEYQATDQIYSPGKGMNLVPWVLAPGGMTWGYTSASAAACEWWRALPTRKKHNDSARPVC